MKYHEESLELTKYKKPSKNIGWRGMIANKGLIRIELLLALAILTFIILMSVVYFK